MPFFCIRMGWGEARGIPICWCLHQRNKCLLGDGEERGEGRWVGNKIFMIYVCMLFGVLKHVTIFTI